MSLEACAALVQRADPDRFMAVMAAPVTARGALLAIYAFNVEVSRAPWVTQEAMIAEMRLQWWRDALEEIANEANVRSHEVTVPLAQVLDKTGADLLDRLVQARRWDIYKDPFEDAAHFDDYLDATSGHLIVASARAVGCGEGESALRDIGYAAGLANWFQAIPELEARGRIPLLDGRAEAIARLAQAGLDRLVRARVPRAAHPALLATWQTKAILRQVHRNPDLVASGGVGLSEFRRRISLIQRSFKS